MSMQNLSQIVLLYCERQSLQLFAEPANFWSNLSFIGAGVFSYLYLHSQNIKMLDWKAKYLCLLMILIGIGSGLFHAYATIWAQIADVVPIGIYVLSFIIIFLSKQHHNSAALIAKHLLIIAVLTSICLFALPMEWSNGSNAYMTLPAWLLFAGYRYNNSKLIVASLVFGLSLFFRIIDRMACTSIPMGTHFLWHVSNGIVLYLTIRATYQPENEVNTRLSSSEIPL